MFSYSGSNFDVFDNGVTRSICLFGGVTATSASTTTTSNVLYGIPRTSDHPKPANGYSFLYRLEAKAKSIRLHFQSKRLAHIQISADVASDLFLGGFLTVSHFMAATESPGCVTLTGVRIDGQTYSVQILLTVSSSEGIDARDLTGFLM